MGKFYKRFVDNEIKTRKGVIEDRKRILSWGLSDSLPSFFIEKTHELKLMVLMGMDNFSYKCLCVYIDEILIHMLVASEIGGQYEYISKLEEYEKKRLSGHHILDLLKQKEIIHPDDFEYCKRFCNDFRNGGERIRNIEVHNLYAEKISNFVIRPEVAQNIDEFGLEFLEREIKSKPGFVHIGARDMVSKRIVDDLAGLNDLLNRNVKLLSVFNQ